MSAKVIEQSSKVDTLKLAVSLVLVVCASVAFYYYVEYPLWMRVLSLLVVAGVALVIAVQTELGRNAWGFVKDARTEVRKVVWPTRTETIQTTLAVILMVVLVGILLWIMDTFLLWAVTILTGQGG
jgi:preprotein translocase subunit SecE